MDRIVVNVPRIVFLLRASRYSERRGASAFVVKLFRKIDDNWELLVKTYEGPGR